MSSAFFRVEDTSRPEVAFVAHRSRFGPCVWSPRGVPVFAFQESAGAALTEVLTSRGAGAGHRRLFLFSVELHTGNIPDVELKDFCPAQMQAIGRNLVNHERFAVLVNSRLGLPERTLLLNPMHGAWKDLQFQLQGKVGTWYAKEKKKAQSL